MKLLRTIRLDPSDTFVFARAAEPGEWAVCGTFAFWAADPATLEGKARAQFRAGFLGVESLGFSTLVQIVEASPQEQAAVVDTLARLLSAHFGAPSPEQARAAAEQEVEFVESLCVAPAGTLLALRRSFEDGEIREQFRTLRPRGGAKPLRAFSFLEVEGEPESGEAVDLMKLAEGKS
jgi:phenylpyruvate tautomerase PptA (4-oxalocrotonate tautomerase family)